MGICFMRKSQKCKKDNLDDAQYCKFCGSPLEKTIYCPNCGKALSSNDVFCDNCGMKIGGIGKSKTKVLLLVGAIVLLLVVIIAKWQSGKTSLDENNNDITQTIDGESTGVSKDVNEKVVGEYADILYSYITGDGSYNEYKFALAYVDTDDIPELLVFQGDYHASMVEIYSFYDGEVCNVGIFGSNGCVTFASKQNLISSFYAGQGNIYYDYYSIQDGTNFLAKSISYTDYDIETEKEAYKIDEKRVSEEEYNQALIQYQNERNWTEASCYNDGFEINETNIERMKNEYEMFAI